VHLKGLEPLAFWFEARRSIQLSYRCKGCDAVSKPKNRFQMVHPKGVEPLTSRFVVWRSIQLSYGCTKEG
jgi:hypothetical protein